MKKILSVLLLVALMFTLTACGGKKEASVNLAEVMGKFALNDEMMELTQDDLRDMYGIDAADVKQFAAAINSTGVKCDEIVLIEAVDEKAAGRRSIAAVLFSTRKMDGYFMKTTLTSYLYINYNYEEYGTVK